MKIRVSTTIHMPEVPPEVEMEPGTLCDLLNGLLRGSYFAKEVVDRKTGELRLDGLFRVLLNDTPYDSLPDGLDTELRDGDRVTLSLILLGGG